MACSARIYFLPFDQTRHGFDVAIADGYRSASHLRLMPADIRLTYG